MICPDCGADTAYDDPCPKDEDSCGLPYHGPHEFPSIEYGSAPNYVD